MTKFGVGVGEDFPVDDRPGFSESQTAENQASGQPSDSEEEGDFRHCGRHGRRAWRRFRHHMKAEWQARRHGFRGRFRHHDADDFVAELHAHHMKKLVIGGLALIGLAAVLGAFHSRR